VNKARRARGATPPRGRPLPRGQDGGSPPPPDPPEPAAEEGSRGTGLLVLLYGLVVVVFGGLSYAALRFGMDDAPLVIKATWVLGLLAIVITPLYMAGWLDRPGTSRGGRRRRVKRRGSGASAVPAVARRSEGEEEEATTGVRADGIGAAGP